MLSEFMKILNEFLKENECNLTDIENKIVLEILITKLFTNQKNKFKNNLGEMKINHSIVIDMILDKFLIFKDEDVRNELIEISKILYTNNPSRIEINSIISLLNILKSEYSGSNSNTKLNILRLINDYCLNQNLNMILNNPDYKEYIPFLPNFKKEDVISFSKSPIRQKESPSHLNLINMLKQLVEGNQSEKVKVLNDLFEIFTTGLKRNSELITNNIDKILFSMSTILTQIFKNKLDENSMEILKYLFNLMYKIALIKEVMDIVKIDTIHQLYITILSALIYDNLEGFGSNEEGKKLVKALNALIVKAIENFNINYSIITLVRILFTYRESKISCLALRCIHTVIKLIPGNIEKIEIDRILYSIYEYIREFEKMSEDLNPIHHNDEMNITILRNLLNELIKLKNENIWLYYKKAIEDQGINERHLKKWIQVILRNKNGLSLPDNPNIMNSVHNSLIKKPVENNEDENKVYLYKLGECIIS
jgi:hypothetical protein